ncbi:MAG: selenocysteine-specific translation elongation factor [Planctomycetes bacterium]|nr:selenocysteine-specific translation elongation factor [Planctomycetota bacterium]
MAVEQINITLGTAGHIDHGKTALIRCLTGCETDLLKAEKERGMSIELGFAPCHLADLEVGIVDVPGHENFIKTMVAGAASMDGVMFIVAADDSVMPQTKEHLDILSLLGIKHGIVALTKIDRVSQEQVDKAIEETRSLLQGTFLAKAPILPVSNITVKGFDGFIEALKTLVESIAPKRTDGLFRMPVERTFSLKGYGTVILGIPVTGMARVGDEVVLLPQGTKGRIRAIQVYKRQSDEVRAGECAALNIPQFEQKSIGRGNVLTVRNVFKPLHWYLTQMRVLDHEKLFIKNGQKVKFHTGTTEVVATVYMMESDLLGANQKGLVQIRATEPLVAGRGDRFILRSLSPMVTIGGGAIVDGLEKRLKRSHAHVITEARELAETVDNEPQYVEYLLKKSELYAARAEELSQRGCLPVQLIRQILQELLEKQTAILLGPGLYMHQEVLDLLEKRLVRIVSEFHAQAPDSPGIDWDMLYDAARMHRSVLEVLLGRLQEKKILAERNGRWARFDFAPTIGGEDAKKLELVESVYRRRKFNPPDITDVSNQAQLPQAEVERLVKLLIEHQKLVSVDKKIIFHQNAIAIAREKLVETIKTEGPLESVKFKYVLDTTRKYAIPLLDYFDRIGLTRRVGYTRHLVE